MGRISTLLTAGIFAMATLSGVALAQDGKTEKTPVIPTAKDHPLEELFSGYRWAKPETQALQDDDFDNPAALWLETGETAWSKKEGEAGKSCSECHNKASASMKGVTNKYPAYYAPWKKLMSLEQRINMCRTKFMKAKAWKWKSNELLGMTIYVNYQSRGMPVKVTLTDKTRPFFEKGKEHYYTRRGQLDMACKNCHEDYAGSMIRANILSQGQSNGFPVYRLKWQKPGSIHRRFRGCNKQVRAKPYKLGSDEYNNLELYVRWRGQGLPIETPAVRN